MNRSWFDTGVRFDDIMRWREALSSCAIEGNQYAIDMLKLWETDQTAFIKEMLRQDAIIALEAQSESA